MLKIDVSEYTMKQVKKIIHPDDDDITIKVERRTIEKKVSEKIYLICDRLKGMRLS